MKKSKKFQIGQCVYVVDKGEGEVYAAILFGDNGSPYCTLCVRLNGSDGEEVDMAWRVVDAEDVFTDDIEAYTKLQRYLSVAREKAENVLTSVEWELGACGDTLETLIHIRDDETSMNEYADAQPEPDLPF
jgi:hypothetical protein